MMLLPASASAAGCTWTGTTSTDWGTASNWTGCTGTGGLPGSSDAVSIGTATNEPAVADGSQSASSVTLSGTGTLSVSGGTLAVSNLITAPAGTNVALSSGTLSFGTLQVDNAAGLTVTGGSLSGTLTATAATTLSIAPTDFGTGLTLGANVAVQQTSSITMSGGVLAIGNDTYQLTNNSSIDASGAGQITIGSGGTLQKLGGIYESIVQPQIVSSGLIEDSSDTGGDLQLQPTIAADVLSGDVKAVSENGAESVVFGNGNYQIGTGGLTLDSPGVYDTQGSANFELNGQTLTLASSTYGLQLNSSGAHVSGAGTVTGVGYLALEATGASLDPGTGNTMTIAGSVLQFAGSDLSGPGTVDVTGYWASLGNQTDSGGATVDVAAGGVLRHIGSAGSFAPPVVDAGTVDEPAPPYSAGDWTLSNLTVTPTGMLTVEAHSVDVTALGNLTSGVLQNGSYIVSNNATDPATLGLPDPVTNLQANVSISGNGALLNTSDSNPALAGLSSIGSGDGLTLSNHDESTSLSDLSGDLALGGTSTLSNTGTTDIGSTGTVSGTGTLTGNVLNAGKVSPGSAATPGTLSIAGNYTQAAGGTLNAKVNGTGAGQFDALQVTGNATLGGTVALIPSSGYAASAAQGDSVNVLAFGGTRAGTFSATTSTPPLTGGKTFAAIYNDADKLVSAVVGLAPSNATLPVITGTTTQGQTLSASNGTWGNNPTFTYAWQLCDTSGNACSNIAGQSASTLLLGATAVGHTVRVAVTATNPYGSVTVVSSQSATVAPAPSPKLSGVRLRPSKFYAKKRSSLTLTLSEPATVTVVITSKVPGRKLHGHCKAKAKTGKRCTVTVTKLKLTFKGRAGANKFAFRVSGLKPGSYTATFTARDAGGRKSKPFALTFTVKKPSKKRA